MWYGPPSASTVSIGSSAPERASWAAVQSSSARRARSAAAAADGSSIRSVISCGSAATSKEHLVVPAVVAVVEGAQVQVVAGAHAPLGDPAPWVSTRWSRPAVVPACRAGASDSRVHVVGTTAPASSTTIAAQVEVVVQPGLHPGFEAGPAQHGGDVGGGLIRALVVAVDAELAELLAVVGADQHGGLVEHSQVGQLGHDGAHRVVRVADADVVSVERGLDVVHARQVPRLAGRGRSPLVGGEPPRLLRRVRAGPLPVGLARTSSVCQAGIGSPSNGFP